MAIKRGRHWKDEPAPDGKRKRTIKNWMHYKEPGWSWVETDTSDMNADTSTPNNWTGNFEFTHQAKKGPLQVFFGDSTDPANTALVGMRSAEHPNHWVNFKALGVNQVAPILQKAQRRVVWPNLWTNSHLAYEYAGHKLNKLIQLTAPGHPASFRFAMRIPAQASYEVRDNRIVLSGPGGAERLVTKPVYGWDANDEPITATLVDAGTITRRGKEFPTYRIIPSAVDLLDATYPVTIDPTVEISGSTDLEDDGVRSGAEDDENHGASTVLTLNYSTILRSYRALFRADVSSIPAGSTVTSATWDATYLNPGAQISGEAYIYRILPANAGWVEGTQNGSQASGEPCWLQLGRFETEWAGGANGCGVIDTDIASADRVTHAWTAPTASGDPFSVSLTSNWVETWINDANDNGGWYMETRYDREGTANNSYEIRVATQEHGTSAYHWTLTIEYTEPAGAGESFTNYEGRNAHRTPRADYQQEPKERKK